MKIYIFGNNPFSEVLRWYIENTTQNDFGGYVVDRQYISPGDDDVISWEDFVNTVDPKTCEVLSSITYSDKNNLRERIFYKIKGDGYSVASYIHPTAVIADNCILGEGNIILERVVMEPYATCGRNNVFAPNALIGHHVCIGDFNFFGSHCIMAGGSVIENKTFLGTNATVTNDAHISSECVIGMDASVKRDMPPFSAMISPKPQFVQKKDVVEKLWEVLVCGWI